MVTMLLHVPSKTITFIFNWNSNSHLEEQCYQKQRRFHRHHSNKLVPLYHHHKAIPTRKHSSRMCTARLLTVSRRIPCISGVVCTIPRVARPRRVCQIPHLWMQTPPGYRSPLAAPPSHVTCDACWEAKPHPPYIQNDRRSLPQTSFEDGNEVQMQLFQI